MLKNDTTFSHMRSSDHLEDSKMSIKDIHAAEFKCVTLKTILSKLSSLNYDVYG